MLKVGVQSAGWYDRNDPLGSFTYIKECGFEAVDFNVDHYMNTKKLVEEGIYPTVFDKSVEELLEEFRPLKEASEQTGVEIPAAPVPTVYIAGMDADCRKKAFALAAELRLSGVNAEVDLMERSVKAQFKYADKIGAKYVAVIGGNELAEGKANVKCMANGECEAVAFADMVAYFQGK